MTQYVVAALYHFTAFDDPTVWIDKIRPICEAENVKGTLLFAPEGLNGTIAGSRRGINHVIATLKTFPGCEMLDWKESFATELPFLRLKVRLKKEIVTMGVEGVSPVHQVGTYVAPEDWNALIDRDDVVVIDTRNDYEVEIGTFEGAVDPQTASFGEFPQWWENNADKFAGKQVAMFCTGGIRCEKASSFLLGQGVNEVFHLKGGILKYLENVPADDTRWNGECFVFDQRVSVGHGLVEGQYELCFACRRPITEAQKAAPEFELGISCPLCIDETTPDQKARFRERHKQVALSMARGERHIGN